MEFYNGKTLLGTDTTSPYGYSWSSVAAGTYSVRAVAYDNAGASGRRRQHHNGGRGSRVLPGPVDRGRYRESGTQRRSSRVQRRGVFGEAAGNDIWNTSDQFQFVYQPVNGDVEIVARVDSVIAVDPFTAAGVMIRGSLQPGSLHGYSTLTGSNGVFFRRRVADGGTTTSVQVAGVTAPTWVRLVRSGTVVTSSWSTDGVTWSVIGSQTLALGTTAYVGLAVCSDNVNARTTARFSNVRVRAADRQTTTERDADLTGQRRDLHRARERDAECHGRGLGRHHRPGRVL